MDALKIKYKDNRYKIVCHTYDFSLFLNELENRLKNDFFKEHRFSACFSFPFSLDEKQLFDLYLICEYCDILIYELDCNFAYSQLKCEQQVFDPLGSYTIYQDSIYLGDIERGVQIQCAANLYVLGEVRGSIDLVYKHVSVKAASFNGAQIRGFDTAFHKTTNFSPSSVYYKDGQCTCH